MSDGSPERLTATVVGHVQGVGFRWWARVQADGLGLTGWITNDADERTVLLVAEGDGQALDEFERRLGRGPQGARVERVEAARGPASGEYRRFEIGRR
jgi:acylphosphatase